MNAGTVGNVFQHPLIWANTRLFILESWSIRAQIVIKDSDYHQHYENMYQETFVLSCNWIGRIHIFTKTFNGATRCVMFELLALYNFQFLSSALRKSKSERLSWPHTIEAGLILLFDFCFHIHRHIEGFRS